jgi:hypothetical protein
MLPAGMLIGLLYISPVFLSLNMFILLVCTLVLFCNSVIWLSAVLVAFQPSMCAEPVTTCVIRLVVVPLVIAPWLPVVYVTGVGSAPFIVIGLVMATEPSVSVHSRLPSIVALSVLSWSFNSTAPICMSAAFMLTLPSVMAFMVFPLL